MYCVRSYIVLDHIITIITIITITLLSYILSHFYHIFLKHKQMYGIEAIEIYFPRTYVDQTDLQRYHKVSPGKYTKGLGQLQLSFALPFEDVNSISLTAVNNLLKNNGIHPQQVGRLQIGTETLIDKSKSTKTVLMSLFPGNHDIEGASSLNACYGATNALLNTLNWISSPAWDGRYGIVVAADVAVYEEGPARPTGGVGAVAMLIGPNPKITFGRHRASFMDHQYDFYKPIPKSEYPIVDGKLSIQCYIKALESCYYGLKQKKQGKNILKEANFLCFHTPFAKMISKAYTALSKLQNPSISPQQIESQFKTKVEPSLYLSKRLGNIYAGSLYSGLIGLLTQNPNISNKNALLFSYGSGLCSTMMQIKIIQNPLRSSQIDKILKSLQNRVSFTPQKYSQIMLYKEQTYGSFQGVVPLQQQMLDDNVFYLKEIDSKWRRHYSIKNPSKNQMTKSSISSMERLESLNKKLLSQQNRSFHKLSVDQRRNFIQENLNLNLDRMMLQRGGLSMLTADSMTENVIGKVSIPLSIVPSLQIKRELLKNNGQQIVKKKYMVPMAIEEPSVVAACSAIAKMTTFFTSSTPSIMIGQVHLPHSQISQIHKILLLKTDIIKELNEYCPAMVQRGGGVKDIRYRQLRDPLSKQFSIDILINVCDAMGANITNTISQKAKQIISKMGIQTGIAILSNYCSQRKTAGWFQIPVDKMGYKGYSGIQVAEKIFQAYEFAKHDRYRATTHNKGIMNGIDAVCIATGQDWRAIQSSAHSYASRSGEYLPLSRYQIITRDKTQYFKGKLELPISVGSRGGSLQKNPLYKLTHEIMGNPSAQELSEIIVCVGLANNFAALRALAIEGIQKGHMILHARSIATKLVPPYLIEQCCKHMAFKKKYDAQTAKEFMDLQSMQSVQNVQNLSQAQPIPKL